MKYQVIVIGGDLGGLCSALHLSLKGIKVLLIEKNAYPKHKVCGEYISN
jgi:menaquinone-9 beta-reductase